MAIQAPLHGQGGHRVNLCHSIDATVALRATDSVGHVGGMIEVDELRQLVDALPANRSMVEPAFAYRRQTSGFLPDLAMAVHTDCGGRHPRVFRARDFIVAIDAVDPVVANMVAMVEGEATVKRFFREADHIRLQPENDALEPIRSKEVKVLGRVVGLLRRV